MRYTTLALVLLLVGCSKPDPLTETGEMRPGYFAVEPSLKSELEEIAGAPIPKKFRSPLPVRKAMKIENEVEADVESLRGAAIRGDEALAKLVDHAAWILERKGHHSEAMNLQVQYSGQYAGLMFRLQTQLGGDLGDFDPLLVWLDKWYQKLESLLGPGIMRATRLEHLKILNYSISVVFHPRGYKGQMWDKMTYVRHFAGTRRTYFYPTYEYDGFAGVVSYWAVWGACAAGGNGATAFLCSPVADYSAYVIGKWPAPKIGQRLYCKQNGC